MNCQEYREMIEDSLDFSRAESPPGPVLRHLEHCTACREHLAECREAHVVLFRSLNEAYASFHLPDGFADRLVETTCMRRGVLTKLRLPRWAVVAASMAIVAGVVFAAAVVVGDSRIGVLGMPFGENDLVSPVAASENGVSDGGSANVPQGQTVLPQTQEEEKMKSIGKSSAVLAAAMLAAGSPSPAAVGSGSPDAAALRSSSAYEPVEPPYGAVSSVATEYIELDARAITCKATDYIPLYTCPRSGILILVF